MEQNIDRIPTLDSLEQEIEIDETEKQEFIDFMKKEVNGGELTLEQIEESFGPVKKAFLKALEDKNLIAVKEEDGETIVTLKRENIEAEPLDDFETLDKAA